ncbi:DUF4180 domain-containing protein [Ralstonia wenshanensis]|uniref:DUF4180 domain-containing protein n=1 Tax=Ralstonia wenshanensis TaxID=2842456 RepID=A0AAD2B0Y0_9RALS|nr:DUF4180 domain-containing protein [Ralstonia wenshanensis]CAJ0697727.1 hypothetical protein LMG18091_02544 [Ralstonia wenshanensis]
MPELRQWNGEAVLCLDEGGPPIASEQNALDHLIGEALGHGATMVAVPVSRLDAAFFARRTGLAGRIAQKITSYRLKLAVVGDISAYLHASSALRDWVRESNKRDTIRFVPSLNDLAADARPLPAE